MASQGVEPKPSKEPKNSKFTQQELPAFKPLLTPSWVTAVFFIIAVVFIPIGAACLAASVGVVEVSSRYDDTCITGNTNAARDAALTQLGGLGTSCNVTLRVPKHMKPPIYVYYQLNNYYQNHRRYVKSRSDTQLRGDGNALSDTTDCPPEQTLNGNNSQVIRPCGLVAWSYFNDTYTVTADVDGSSRVVAVNEKGIAWGSDVKYKFGSVVPEYFNSETNAAHRGGATITGPLNQDEHFIVWMRTSALANFRKLWGRIDTDIPRGASLTVNIANRYNTYRFDGQKHIVLSTASWLGGSNKFLGIAYVVVGGVSFLCGLLFFLVQWQYPRQRGDVAYLSWNANGNSLTTGM